MTRPPRRAPGSRRDKRQYFSGIGPEGLPRGNYKVELVFTCRFDGTEMGRAVRYTPPDMDGETETRPTSPGSGFLPREESEEGYAKWRFFCEKCGHDVPIRDARVEEDLDAIFAPWARRSVRVPI